LVAVTATDTHRAIDAVWRIESAVPDLDAALDDDVGDDLLRLVFTACHPVLSTEARVALTLRLPAKMLSLKSEV
jgi:predicted RNA polymerase sigma factor